MTHNELNDIAVRWLKRAISNNGAGCQVAMSEVGGYFSTEKADAWGYTFGKGSIVVESKVSRSDFLCDKKKPHRLDPEKGMGKYRYYICPEGLINIEDLPDRWGLVWVNKRGHTKLVAGHLTSEKPCYEVVIDGKKHDAKIDYKALEFYRSAWAFKQYDTNSEIDLLAHLHLRFDKLGGTEEINNTFKKHQRMINHLSNENIEKGKEIRDLKMKLYQYQR